MDFRFRDRETADKIVKALKEMKLNITLMHVCGTHQDSLVKFGLDSIFKECGVKIRQGPGCPVCVTTPREIEEGMELARRGKAIATFGDMVRVPGEKESLADIRAKGGDVNIVYSIDDAVEMARENPTKEIVFMAVGFETTAPATASAILSNPPSNFSILNCHRYVPPALKAIIQMGEVKIQGLIEPGHVSTILGTKPYEFLSRDYKVPQVIAGFEPLDLLMSVYLLARQIKEGRAEVENEYGRLVKEEGNVKAVNALEEVFEPGDVEWRGFPIIASSAMVLKKKFEKYDARKKFKEDLKEIAQRKFPHPKGCRCGEVLRGLIDSQDCPLFGKVCTPKNPIGPCMVSMEGNCNIEYRYGAKKH